MHLRRFSIPLIAPLAALLIALVAIFSGSSASASISKKQKLTVEQITSIFENSTPDFVYNYLEDIGDGAGVTAGRVGFNSNAGDLFDVVNEYLSAKPAFPKPPLSDYLECLDSIQGTPNYQCLYPDVDSSTMATADFKSRGLLDVDFGLAWEMATADPLMKKVQDEYVEKNYFLPAMAAADQLGLQTAIGVALIYDTVIQMDGLPQMEKETQARFAQTHQGRSKPANRAEEAAWLHLYQAIRKATLSESPIGIHTTARVDALSQILDSGNMDLNLPFSFTCGDERFELK